MNSQKLFSVGLALLLQVLPLARFTAIHQALIKGQSALGMILRLGTATAALLGPVHAVSGASTVISSANTALGTNGVAFSYRVTTKPDPANVFSAVPLPAGLVIARTTGKITGTPTESGVFSVKLTASDNGRADRTVSMILTLTIKSTVTTVAPTLSAQPKGLTVNAGASAAFTVTAAGTAPLTYQWALNGRDLSGATASSLQIPAVTAADEGSYTVKVTNAAGSVTSAAAALKVITPPAIQRIVSPTSVAVGNSVTLSVEASGTAPLAYQWALNGQDISGATSASLILPAATGASAGSYTVRVTNAAGSAVSQPVSLAVQTPAAVSSISGPSPVAVGKPVTLTVTASGTAPLSIQWFKDGVAVAGATSTDLSIAAAKPQDGGSYTVVVSNAAGSVTSTAFALAISIPVAEPATLFAGSLRSGGFEFTAKGPASGTLTVWVSTDLVTWRELTSKALNSDSTSITDSTTGAELQRFYRVSRTP